MEWYLKVVRDNYANFNGRARREEFWMFNLVNAIISFFTGFIDGAIGIHVVSGLYFLAVLVPSIAVSIRRLHDINKSGWWLLGLSLFIFIGWIWLFILSVKDSDIGDNNYGASDKYPDANDSDDDFLLDEEE